MTAKDDGSLWIEAEETARRSVLTPEARRRLGRTERIWNYRSYQGGEEAASIDWRQSARTDKILVREAEEMRARPVYLWAGSDARFLLIAAALGFMLIKGNRAVGWLGAAAKATKTAALWREGRPSDAPPPQTPPYGRAAFVFFADKTFLAAGNDVLKNYARQGFEGIVVADKNDASALSQTAQTIGWPLLRDDPAKGPDETLLAAFEETLPRSI